MKYDLFISYSSKDRKLHFPNGKTVDVVDIFKKYLEAHDHPGFPKRKFRVCTDYDDFDLKPTVSEAIYAKLENSQALLVLCSPSSKASSYVNQEINFFQKVPERQIIAAQYLSSPNETFANIFGPNTLGVNLSPNQKKKNWLNQLKNESHKLVALVWELPLNEAFDRFVQAERRRSLQKKIAIITPILILLVGSFFIWYQIHLRQMSEQIQNRISEIGGTIEFVDNGDRIIDLRSSEKIHNGLLDSLRYIGNITEIHFPFEQNTITDTDLSYIGNLENLKVISLGYSNITGKGLQALKGLSRLESLSISGVSFGRDQLKTLQVFSGLKDLSFFDCEIHSSDLKYIAKSKQLQFLNMFKTEISNEGVSHLKDLTLMKDLSLSVSS